MRLSHAAPAISPVFDEPHLVSCAGLVPVLVAGVDTIDGMDLLRHGGMGALFEQVRAPSTLGTVLPSFTFGHVRQLDAVAARLLGRLARAAPLLPGANLVAFVDVDDTVREVRGYPKQGAGYGYTGVNGLTGLLGTVTTPTAPPVIVATRLRKGAANSARGAARLVGDAVRAARAAGATGLIVVRAGSAFYGYPVVAAARAAGARFSLTARRTPPMAAAIGRIDEQAWTPIRCPRAVWDDDKQWWISDAEIAEVPFTAFTGRRKAQQVTGRLIVRRVRRLNPATAPATTGSGEQGELFAAEPVRVGRRSHLVLPTGLRAA